MSDNRVYPAPTVVVGLGRFGLAVLEALGEDWQGLRLSGSDASLDNLRLLWVHPEGDELAPWRRREAPTVHIARYVDNSDMPSLALDFAILRSLGLVRFHHGCYQVAMPQDRGLIDRGGEQDSRRLVRCRFFEWLNLTPDPITSAERLKREAEDHADLDLFVTPIINRVRQGHAPGTLLSCIARCRSLAEGRDPSPWVWLREELASWRAAEGCEPWCITEAEIRKLLKPDEGYLETLAPEPLERWRDWLDGQWKRHSKGSSGGAPSGDRNAPKGKRFWDADAWARFLEGVRKEAEDGIPALDDVPGLDLRIPGVFGPRPEDPVSPLEPAELLQVDWQATGWATEKADDDKVYYGRADVSDFRLGFFDHDTTVRAEDGVYDRLDGRLRELSRLVHKGLVRLWVDLQRERVEENEALPLGVRAHDHIDNMLKQSLEVLGGLVVHPVIQEEEVRAAGDTNPGAVMPEAVAPEAVAPEDSFADAATAHRVAEGSVSGGGAPGDGGTDGVGPASDAAVDGDVDGAAGSAPEGDGDPSETDWTVDLPDELAKLPRRPSSRLSSLRLLQADRVDDPMSLLDQRLADLGLEDARRPDDLRLLRRVALSPGDLEERPSWDGVDMAPEPEAQIDPAEGVEPEDAGDGSAPPRGREFLPGLRRTLNAEVRRLLGFSFLARYRNRPTRQPPRLTVFVVGDLGEPFSRNCMRPVLRALHAELLRAFGPMFEINREGFDRALSIVPILWMPHPSDPCDGASIRRTRIEEAAIIEGVHGVRRWVESVLPRARRRVSQIFINGRVTDTAVLSCRDSVRQTRDFVSLLCRNDIGREDWLRRAAVGPGGSDFFSSFACFEIEFPAERSREYLANRLARLCLERIQKNGSEDGEPECGDGPVKPPAKVARESDAVQREVGKLTEDKAKLIRGTVQGHLAVDLGTPARRIQDAFAKAFGDRLWGDIVRTWRDLSESRGRMDELVDQLRRVLSKELGETLDQVRRYSDREIEGAAGSAGLGGAMSCLSELQTTGRAALVSAEQRRRNWEVLCSRHRRRTRSTLDEARRRVVEAAERKPDLSALQIGAVLVLAMAPVLGAAPLFAVSQLLGLHLRDGAWRYLEVALGPLAPWTAVLPVMALVWVCFGFHLKQATGRVQRAIDALAGKASQIVQGRGKGLTEDPDQEPSIRSFFEARLALTSALAGRRYAAKVYEQTVRDYDLAHRLGRSIEIQLHLLRLRAERLGVRPAPEQGADHDDVRDLFGAPGAGTGHALIPPDRLIDYFERHVRAEEEGDRLPLARFLRWSGGFDGWRESACLSSSEEIMGFGRHEFDSILKRPITDQYYFAEEIGDSLCQFVETCFSNMGFGAKFLGYEGLDPDGVRIAANAALLLDAPLRKVFDDARGRGDEARNGGLQLSPALRPGRSPEDELMESQGVPGGRRRRRRRVNVDIQTLDIEEHPVRPNAAYMVSLVQGIRAHSVRNLKRFESFHDRPEMPDDRTFPLSPDHGSSTAGRPIDHLEGCEDWARKLYRRVRRREGAPPRGA
ncbi:MAG: hypothetical protein AAGN66_07330 [Acidobacteriota bacterium]